MKKQENEKNRVSFKTPKRFRLTFFNENTFNEVWSVKMSQTRVILSVIAIMAAIGCIVSTIIVFTPIRTLLPGYLKTSQRQENIMNSLRIDSLTTRVNITSAYVENLSNILSDSIDISEVSIKSDNVAQVIPIDSIIGASATELQFIQQFEDKEKYNLSVLSPIAADGMMFYSPTRGATITPGENESMTTITLTAPALSAISAIYNGTIVDTYYTPATGNVIIIQHPNDFISKYAGMSEIFVSNGAKVATGQRIGLSSRNQQSANYPLTFDLWHKGTPLNPLDYIAF